MSTEVFNGDVCANEVIRFEVGAADLRPEGLVLQQCWYWHRWLLCRAQFEPQPNPILQASRQQILLPAEVCRAVPKRQSEYLAGRLLLRQLQLELGLSTAQILPAADRSPQWPAGQQGSLSHSAGQLLAGMSAKSGYRLGVDLEQWLTQTQYTELASAILSTAELKWFQQDNLQQQGLTHWSEPKLLTLIFAAKEALFKALYPDCQVIMEFSAAKVRMVTSRQILLQLTTDWSTQWCAGSEIWLDYQAETNLVQVVTEVKSRL